MRGFPGERGSREISGLEHRLGAYCANNLLTSFGQLGCARSYTRPTSFAKKLSLSRLLTSRPGLVTLDIRASRHRIISKCALSMNRVGLALSGGGFRATLYHLGVVRFLRDSQILPKITHITAVSGGSILGAHLALNWDRYCGPANDFEEVANEIIRFVQLDVRNRIVRRFPLASMANYVRRLSWMGASRKLTRAGLLERHYERFLYGDTSLFQLPDKPRLHILATNVSEGCLCSFYRDGLLLQRRTPGQRDRFEKVHLGLATVPMAVAASSAFPGFFPPLEINGSEVGAEEGEFNRQAFTDGGIFDNLGLRMFRCIEESWIRDIAPLTKGDVLELEVVTSALMSAGSLPENTPLRRLWEMVSAGHQTLLTSEHSSNREDCSQILLDGLWEIIRSEELFRDPIFQGMELVNPNAQSLLHYVRSSNYEPELSDRLWLNRQIVASALQQVVGRPCLRPSRGGFDGILVSDAGKAFKVTSDGRAGGLIGTALRSSDILMDRVYQLELESFQNSSGVLFFPMTDVVERSQDPNAPHPEIQRQAARIRTDLDRFSELEISALVQHGYCVARKACRDHAALFDSELPTGRPWDPFAQDLPNGGSDPGKIRRLCDENRALSTARRLRPSSARRVWGTLFNIRDWPTYFWIPLLACVILALPYALYTANERASQQRMVLTAISEMSPVYRKILDLLERGPAESLGPAPYLDVDALEPPDFTGFEIVSDTRVFDLRSWSDPIASTYKPFSHVRVRVRRTGEGTDNAHLRFQLRSVDDKLSLFCRTESLTPVLSRMRETDGSYLWQLDLDFSHVPLGGDTEVVFEGTIVSEMAEQLADEGRFKFTIPVSTGMVQIWMLMPEGRAYDYFEISGYPLGKPELAQTVEPDTKVELPLGSLATFRLINPQANYRYECRWKWNEQSGSTN